MISSQFICKLHSYQIIKREEFQLPKSEKIEQYQFEDSAINKIYLDQKIWSRCAKSTYQSKLEDSIDFLYRVGVRKALINKLFFFSHKYPSKMPCKGFFLQNYKKLHYFGG